jgi:hypothetical protein
MTRKLRVTLNNYVKHLIQNLAAADWMTMWVRF